MVFVFHECHDTAWFETISQSAQHELDVGLIHQHQPADECIERPNGRAENIGSFKLDVRQANFR